MTDAVVHPDSAAARGLQAPYVIGADGAPVDWLKVYLGFAGLAIGYFMALLDIQIVAAALADVQAGVGASADEIGWIQSVYLLAEVVTIPLSAYLSKLWGTRNSYLGATIIFILTSVAVGFSTSIEAMIFTRALQGFAAGAMMPATFAIAMTAFPPDRRLQANVIVSMIVTLAPMMGPTLGGHIAEQLSWRWLFFVNVPPGLLAIFLVWRWGNFDRPDPSLAKGIDWWGVVTMAVFLIAMQWVLEEGAEESWFQDDRVIWLTVLTIVSGAVFIWRQLSYRQPIVSLKPFADRNFTLGVSVNFVAGIALFGGTFILPLYLAYVRQYSASEVGTVMLVSGLVSFMVAPVLGRIIRAVDFRVCLVGGMLLTAWGMWQGVRVTSEWGFWEFAGLQAARGLGSMVAMIAASQMSVATIPPHMMKDASSLLNLIRNVGGAVGIAAISTILFQQTAEHYQQLAARMSVTSQRAQEFMATMTERMAGLGVADAEGAARKSMSFFLQREASVLAYGDAFAALAVACLVAAVVSFLATPAGLRAPGPGQPPGAA